MTAVTVLLAFLATPPGYLSIVGLLLLACGILKAAAWLRDRRRREVSDAELARLPGWERPCGS